MRAKEWLSRLPISRRMLFRLVAIVIFLMGLVNITSGLFPALVERRQFISDFVSFDLQYGGRLTTIFTGFLLLLLSNNLARHKKIAWWLTEILLLVSVGANLAKGFDYEEASFAFGLFILLLPLRSLYQAKSDPVYLKSIPVRAVLSFLALIIYGVIGFGIMHRRNFRSFSPVVSALDTVSMITTFYNPHERVYGRQGGIFIDSLYVLGAGWYAYLSLLILSPVLIRQIASEEERNRANTIVGQYGRSAIARYTLFPDKLYFFTPGGSVIAYIVKSGVAVTLGDPIGPHEDLSAAIDGFAHFARQNDWIVCFYQILAETTPTYLHHDFKLVPIGEDGIINLQDFSLEGSSGKEFRYSLNKLEKQGYHTEVVNPPNDDVLVDTLNRISEEWLESKSAKEMRFSLGWFHRSYLRSTPIMLVRDSQQQIIAFVTLIPEFSKNELTIDLMRQVDNLPNGTMDYLFVSVILWAKEQGYQTFNLGLSPLAGVGAEKADPLLEKSLRFVFHHASQFYNFRGLHGFKEKFHPKWSTRYLAYSREVHLPQIGLAMMNAHRPGQILEE